MAVKSTTASAARPPVHILSPSFLAFIPVVGIAGSVKFIGIAFA
jgi:hypothetical protein